MIHLIMSRDFQRISGMRKWVHLPGYGGHILKNAVHFDMEMLEGWRDGLDVLLVFVSALFNSHCIFTHMCIGRSLLSRGHYICRSNITEPPS